MMATKEQVLHLYNNVRELDDHGIAERLGCQAGYVRATIQRAGLPSITEREERAKDQRDLDILSDLQDGHSQGDCAKFYGVPKTYVRNLAVARKAAA